MDKITVQHYLCPETEGTEVTHHLAPRTSGRMLGEVSREQECIWCHRTEDDLREDIRANGGELHPHIAGVKQV